MKKFSLLLALTAFTTIHVPAATIVLDPNTNRQDITPTVIGQTYTVTPVSGALNLDNNVSGCNGSGSDCAEGFEFIYSLDPSPSGSGGQIDLVTDKFSTAAAAFAASQGTTFTALDTNAEFFLTCGSSCRGAFGSLTLDILLQQILSTVTTPTLTGNDFLALSYDPDEVVHAYYYDFAAEEMDARFEKFMAEMEGEYDKFLEQLVDIDSAESLDSRDILLDYTDSDAANLAFIEAAKAIGEIFGDTETVAKMLDLELDAAHERFTDKVKEFIATEQGAELWAQRDEHGHHTNEFYEASREYGASEFREWMGESDDASGRYEIFIYNREIKDREIASADQTGGDQDSGDLDNQEDYIDIIIGPDGKAMTLDQALQLDDQYYMNNQIESVIPELAGIIVGT